MWSALGFLIFFLLGFAGGVFVKFGFDYYQNFLIKQQKNIDALYELSAKWQLIEDERKQK